MSESFSIHQVSTTPIPFGVSIKWKWPEASYWFSRLELQYLLSNGQLVKEIINWPVTEKRISGLKAGEHLQVRLRPVAADGSALDWRTSDWLNGVSSVDAGEMIQALQDDIRSNAMFDALSCDGGISPEEIRDAVEHIKRTRLTKALGKSLAELSPFVMKDGKVFIKDAFIQTGTTASANVESNSAGSTTYNCNMRINVDEADKTIREKVHAVVASYLTPEASEYVEEMVDELMSLKVPAICNETAIARFVSERVKQVLQRETRPGGSIHNAIKR